MEATIGFDLRSIVPDPSWTADRPWRRPGRLGSTNGTCSTIPKTRWPYAAVTATRVPEHAPFYGYGIYQLT
jgi:hypothetical protein